jgi:hypothetical protein
MTNKPDGSEKNIFKSSIQIEKPKEVFSGGRLRQTKGDFARAGLGPIFNLMLVVAYLFAAGVFYLVVLVYRA